MARGSARIDAARRAYAGLRPAVAGPCFRTDAPFLAEGWMTALVVRAVPGDKEGIGGGYYARRAAFVGFCGVASPVAKMAAATW
jgi:hypothetical protein